MHTVQKHLLIRGRVQGVGFRQFTRKTADSLGVRGWVRNRKDGRVEAVIEGAKDRVGEMMEQLGKGPAASRVDSIDIVESPDALEMGENGGFSSFEVRP